MPIREIDLRASASDRFVRRFASCLVVTHDKKILLQQRGAGWSRFPNAIATFGGEIDEGETHLEGMIRELNEELGAVVNADDAMFLGAFTKSESEDEDLICSYFWHDKDNTITGCYEGHPVYFETIADALKSENALSGIPWILKRSERYIANLLEYAE